MGTALFVLSIAIVQLLLIIGVGVIVYKLTRKHRLLLSAISIILMFSFLFRGTISNLIFMNNLCENKAGRHINKKVSTDRYLFIGEDSHVFGIDFILSDLVGKYFQVVEVDLKAEKFYPQHIVDVSMLPQKAAAWGKAIPGYNVNDNKGYLKFFTGKIKNKSCYNSEIGNGEIVLLRKKHLEPPGYFYSKKDGYEKLVLPDNQCIGVVWTPTSSSKYSVRTYSKSIYPGIREKGIKVEDKFNSIMYGGVFAYECKPTSTLEVVANAFVFKQLCKKKCNYLPRDQFSIHREILSHKKTVMDETIISKKHS